MKAMRIIIVMLWLSASLLVVSVLSQDSAYQIIDLETFTLEGGPTTIAWSPDDTRIAVSNTDNVFLCTLAAACDALTQEDIPLVTALAWHPSDELLATSGAMFNLWDTINGDNVGILDFPQNEATDGTVQWNHSGNLLAFTTSELVDEVQLYTINLWSVNHGIFTEIPVEIATGLHTLVWSADDEIIAISDFDHISIWNQSLSEIIFTFSDYSNVYEICGDATNNEFLFGAWTLDSRTNSVYVLNGTDGEPSNIEFTFENAISSIDCNPISNSILAIGTLDGAVTIVDIDTQNVILVLDSDDYDISPEITDLAWNSRGDKLAVGNNMGIVAVYSLNLGSEN